MRIKQQVYWYWYFPVKMLFGIKGSLCKTPRRNFLQLDESLIKFADQAFYEKGYKKEICRILGSEWIRIQNIEQKIYFFWLLHTVLAHQKLLIKNKRVFCMSMKLSISRYFDLFLGLKTVCQSRSLEVFGYWYVEVRDKTSTSSYQKVKNIWKRDYIAFVH